MANAKDASVLAFERILMAGRTGSGKTTQILTLPGRKFAYLFDPAALLTLRGHDVDYEQFLPEFTEMDATLKGFNKGAKSDRPSSAKEPTLYKDWVDDLNTRITEQFLASYDWLCFDSLTLLVQAVMERQLYINGRYGDIEDLGDYRVVGSKVRSVFRTILSLPINIYCTGHIDSFQDEKTKRIEFQLRLPGQARAQLPLMFSNIWQASREEKDGKTQYMIRTVPDPRGFQDIRTTLRGLPELVNVTIADFNKPAQYGVGQLLTRAGFRTKQAT